MLKPPRLADQLRWLAVRRALRAGAIDSRFRRHGFGPRRSPPPLPEALRGRLLAIPATTPRRTGIVSLAPTTGGGLHWLLASPAAPLMAGFVLALGLSLAWGNPYQAGAATVDLVRDQARPATSRIRDGATAFATVAAELGEQAMGALPRAGQRASHAVNALLLELGPAAD